MNLPDKAIEYYNTKAEELSGLIKLYPPPQKGRQNAESSLSHVPITTLNENHIISISRFGLVDGLGRSLARFFIHEKKQYGLNKEDYRSFHDLVTKLAERHEIRNLLSKDFIEDTIFEWLEGRFKNIIQENVNMLDHVFSKAQDTIQQYRISVPISYLAIQTPFEIGNVMFEYLKRDLFDNMKIHMTELAEKQPTYNQAEFEQGFQRLRKKYQGAVVASMVLEAEEKRAIELAIEQTDSALMVLRFFSPSAFLPIIPSYFARMGQSKIPSTHVFVFTDSFPTISEEIDESRDYMWNISEVDIHRFNKLGLGIINKLIRGQIKSELGDVLLNSIAFYTKGTTSLNLHDKLVFTLVALETLLLKDSNEPLQINIGQRLAFLAGQTPVQRKEILKCVRTAYGLRSSYLHHGEKKSDIKTQQNLQAFTWDALWKILLSLKRFTSREEILADLERQILS